MKRLQFYPIIILLFCSLLCVSQNKLMTPEVYDEWNTIEKTIISPNGEWVAYNLKPDKGDNILKLYNTKTDKKYSFERAEKAKFDVDNNFIAFTIVAHKDSIDKLKRKKVKQDKMPKDTLGIFIFKDLFLDKVANVESFKLPKKTGSVIAYKKEKRSSKKDSILVKKEGDNGTQLFVLNIKKKTIHNFNYVKEYMWSDFNQKLLVHSTGEDSLQKNIIYLHDVNTQKPHQIFEEKGKYTRFAINAKGDKVAFLADRDTTKNETRPLELIYWAKNKKTSKVLANNKAIFLPEGWQISNFKTPEFSENSERLYFAMKPIEPEQDSSLLEEEKVEVEIWNYKDGLLHTQQNVRLKREKERSYTVVYDIKENKFTPLANESIPQAKYDKHITGQYYLSESQLPYETGISWEGYSKKDAYLTNIKTGKRIKIAESIHGTPTMSPSEKYVTWFSLIDTSWMAYNIKTHKTTRLTKGKFYDELNDRPMPPSPSGHLGWTQKDEHLLIYDQYDIWKIDPTNGTKQNLTNGRADKKRYRYIRIDREVKALPYDTSILLKVFDEKDKTSGYAKLNLKSKQLILIESGKYDYNTRIVKAKNADALMFTKGNFQTYPDLILSDINFSKQKTISSANPQRSEYKWGSIELVSWIHPDGKPSEGLLVKPADFDPEKKYPMIVNFYERSSQGLYRNRDPYPHRSTINYSYWANKGYVIFNPDVRYKNGYPGKSCEEAVMSGVDHVLKMGFVDESRMGLQGHSWGGYQIAHLLTKTDRFKCAEAGAPVVNMVSAYGGIRWGSGMSRMFQYERTQSRLGATLWERPDLYLENSPIFEIDKVTTPVLILHNDKDGAVPWYQGIEYFVALRRLGKPAWMLNYNDEPHWPVKRQNRIDFNKRLEQFFDHYLMDKPIPEWMDRGVPAVEKEYNDGFELMKN